MVLVDTVYQRVLALANKEQRGYITPQEFNLFANQAQMDIFEQYFHDLSQFLRRPGNSTMYSDPVDILEEKIERFHASGTLTDVNDPSNIFPTNDLASGTLYRLSQVRHNYSSQIGVSVEKLTHDKITSSMLSPLTAPTLRRPAYYLKGTKIIVTPKTITSVDVNYIRRPVKVEWSGYSVSGSDMYDSTHSVNFELHPSEETKLVIKILGLAGVTLKDPSLYQIAGAEDNKNIQQEKQ